MPERTKEQMIDEINTLGGHIAWCVERSQRDGLDLLWIDTAKRRAQELAVECQRLLDLLDEGIGESIRNLRAELAKDDSVTCEQPVAS
jgi:hypothetical protein